MTRTRATAPPQHRSKLTALEEEPGELATAPIVDSEGYWFIVHSGAGDGTLRLADLPAPHGAHGLGDCF